MPVHKLPNGKYKWGNSGKEYTDPKDAYAQGSAIEHSGWHEKNIPQSPNLQVCVRNLLADPTFKPEMEGDTKEKAAHDICQGALNKAMDDIQEAITILRKFEDGPNQYSLLSPSDYDSYGLSKELEVPASSINNDGEVTQPDAEGMTSTTKELIEHAADPFQEVRLNNPQEPANMLGGLNPDTDTSEDVTNVTDNPAI